MKIYLVMFGLTLMTCNVYANDLKLLCKSTSSNIGVQSLEMILDKKEKSIKVTWGRDILINRKYELTDSNYTTIKMKGDGNVIERYVQLNRQTLVFTVIAPPLIYSQDLVNWYIEGTCKLNVELKI